jgi:hypothetical protein
VLLAALFWNSVADKPNAHVGWGERSDAQQTSPATGTLGIVLLTPTYAVLGDEHRWHRVAGNAFLKRSSLSGCV